MEDYSDQEICNILPEIVRLSKNLYKTDDSFKKEVEMFSKCIADKSGELISKNGTIKANAVILACFGAIRSTFKAVTDEYIKND